MKLPKLPVPLAWLRRFRWKADERSRGTLGGVQLLRRKGQSLDFRGFAEYQPGTDLRHVDWKASARRGVAHRLLVREFEAEESIRIVLSLDFRDTMAFPASATKADRALALAWTIGAIGLMGDDRVVLHALFGGGPAKAREFRGAGEAHKLWRALHQLRDAPAGALHLAPLERDLPPASAWILLSDFYFADEDGPAKALREKIRAKRDSRRVLAIDLDSWPAEAPEPGAWRLEGPGRGDRSEVQLGAGEIEATRQKIEAVKSHVLTAGLFPESRGLVRWPWPRPGEPDDFWLRFRAQPQLRNLFVK